RKTWVGNRDARGVCGARPARVGSGGCRVGAPLRAGADLRHRHRGPHRPSGRRGMSRRMKSLLAVAPLGAVAVASTAFVLASDRSPSRLHLDRAWAAPSTGFPFGFGEAGVDLLALVAHATARALLLASVVALIGLVVGAPLGTIA